MHTSTCTLSTFVHLVGLDWESGAEAARDKMPSYVELLSCVEVMRDARNLQNVDLLESDDATLSPTRRRRK